MPGRDDGLSPGDIGDPVADNLRAEMNRDAAPSKEEAERQARNHLAREGCVDCGEDDPDRLHMAMPDLPSCPMIQVPRDPSFVICDDCSRDRLSARGRVLKQARDQDEYDEDVAVDGVVFYECGNHEIATRDLTVTRPRRPRVASVGVRCPCGAQISDAVYGLGAVDD